MDNDWIPFSLFGKRSNEPKVNSSRIDPMSSEFALYLQSYENDLKKRENELSKSLAALTKRSEQCQMRERKLTEREDTVSRQKADVVRREGAVSQRERELSHRKADVVRREEAVSQRETELSRRKADVVRREEAVSQRETELSRREDVLSSLESERFKELVGAHLWGDAANEAERIHQDRAAVNAQMEAISGAVTGAKEELYQLTETFRQLLQQTADVKHLLTMSDLRPALEDICSLHRTLELMQSAAFQNVAMMLANILQMRFGARPITPQPGSPFDGRFHERKMAGQQGSVIAGCYSCGWLLNEQTLLRAVVDTEDEEERTWA